MTEPSAALLAYLRAEVDDGIVYRDEPRPLRGGFVTDVSTFSLDRAPAEWSGKLVLRVFPPGTDVLAVRRERCAQEVVAAQGVPAPRVLACEDEPGTLEGPFMVMEYLPGRPQMTIEMPRMLADVPRLGSLPGRHAGAMHMVHALAAGPLVAAFEQAGIDRRAAGPDNWLDSCERRIGRWGFVGLRDGLTWLRGNRPAEPDPPSICHGDLFGANILEVRGRVTAILDWNLVTVGDPAIDLGGQIAGNEMTAMPGPRVIGLAARGFGKMLARGLRRAYAELAEISEERVRYYAAMRAFTELVFKLGSIEEVRATGVPRRMPTWRPPDCARYFETHAGVSLDIDARG